MGFYLSPGVVAIETDLSNIVPTVATTTSGIVGFSKKGPLVLTLVTNKQQFVELYGEPEPGNYFHYSALSFLDNGSNLYCLRVVNGALYGGVHVQDSTSGDDNVGIDLGQESPVFYDESDLADELFTILGKDPGLWNNSVSVIVKNVKTVSEEEVTEQYTFEIDVYFTDAEGTTAKVENWKVSRVANKLDGNGRQMYLETVVNEYSKYIVVADSTRTETLLPKANATAVSMTGGSEGETPTASQIGGVEANETGWWAFGNEDNVDVRILIGGGFMSTHSISDLVVMQSAMRLVAESRRDCVALMDVPYTETDPVTDSVTFRTTTQNFNSSYCCLYTPWVRINDYYNDRIIDVPASGYVASQIAYNDYIGHPWTAPAGFTRGLVNALSLNKVFTKGERDTLFPQQINPLQVFRGYGTAIWGQRTLQRKQSALSDLNVRRMLIVIEKAISIFLRDFVFELNNDLTRLRIVGVVEQYLDQLAAQGAFQQEDGDIGYQVICDSRNNTPEVIDRNELHVDIFVKPVRVAYFIQLQTIITTTGASFEELISRGQLI
jgi:phage tail sheath protein FI